MSAAATPILMQLRQTGRTMQPITDLPYWIGYTVEREVAEALGETVGGWKVAIGPDGAPIGVPLLASTIHGDGVRLNLPASDFIKIETELALRLARDLPPRATPLYAPVHCGRDRVRQFGLRDRHPTCWRTSSDFVEAMGYLSMLLMSAEIGDISVEGQLS